MKMKGRSADFKTFDVSSFARLSPPGSDAAALLFSKHLKDSDKA
jgi:hypothetical protein